MTTAATSKLKPDALNPYFLRNVMRYAKPMKIITWTSWKSANIKNNKAFLKPYCYIVEGCSLWQYNSFFIALTLTWNHNNHPKIVHQELCADEKVFHQLKSDFMRQVFSYQMRISICTIPYWAYPEDIVCEHKNQQTAIIKSYSEERARSNWFMNVHHHNKTINNFLMYHHPIQSHTCQVISPIKWRLTNTRSIVNYRSNQVCLLAAGMRCSQVLSCPFFSFIHSFIRYFVDFIRFLWGKWRSC